MPLVGMVLNALIIQELYRASKIRKNGCCNPLPGRSAVLNRGNRPHAVPAFPFRVEHYLVAFFLIGSLDNRGQHLCG